MGEEEEEEEEEENDEKKEEGENNNRWRTWRAGRKATPLRCRYSAAMVVSIRLCLPRSFFPHLIQLL